MSINLLEVPIPDDNICCICHDTLNSSQIYTLPECKHSFHTHCIVTWFRHRGSLDFAEIGATKMVDGKCPLCCNKGINHRSNGHVAGWNNYRGVYLSKVNLLRFKTNKKFIKGINAPKELKQLYNKLLEKEEKFKTVAEQEKEYRKTIQSNNVNYNETKKTLLQFRRLRWGAARQLNAIKRAISSLPIVPLIIPTPIDIN